MVRLEDSAGYADSEVKLNGYITRLVGMNSQESR